MRLRPREIWTLVPTFKYERLENLAIPSIEGANGSLHTSETAGQGDAQGVTAESGIWATKI